MSIGTELRFVAFGDSITEAIIGDVPQIMCWPVLLGKAITALFPEVSITVFNEGVGGQTSREGLQRFEKDVCEKAPTIVTIMFSNDITDDPARSVPLHEYIDNLTRMAELCHGINAQPVLMTQTPVIDIWHAMKDSKKYTPTGGLDLALDVYRVAVHDLAITHGIPMVDLYEEMRKAIRLRCAASQIMPDGVHLTEEGNRTVAAAMLPVMAGVVHASYKQPNAHIL